MGRIVSLRRVVVVPALVAVFLITGCESTEKRDLGTLIGGAVGAWIGHEVDDGGAGGIVLGALAGAFVGRMIGEYMDQSDRERLQQTIEDTPSGQTVNWTNENTGNDFMVTPTSEHYAEGDKQCRTFDQVVIVDGREEVMQGVACRSPGSDELEIDGMPV